MEITHLGHASFKIRGKNATVVTDPYNPEFVGRKYPKVESDIVTISHQHQDHNFVAGVGGEPVVIAGPGEYEVKGVRVMGLPSFHDEEQGAKRGRNTIYQITIDSITILHLGDLGDKLDEKSKELLSGADILMIPVGGFYTISAATAAEIATNLEASIIIPMHYKTADLTSPAFAEVTGVDIFLKEMGKEAVAPQPKLVITKDKIPGEPTIVVLE